MRRSRILALAGAALLLLSSVALGGAASAATLAAATTCSNGVDNTGGLGLICEVTIDNTFTTSGGTATVTVRECHGAAGDPEADCTTTNEVLTEPVTSVTQCNGSINGGGGTLRCSVVITNHFVGVASTPTAVAVNQCVGSGDGVTTGCDPFPATTSGAAVTQCNGSANGGTLVGLECTAAGQSSASHLVTIDQCNGSGSGGGGLVICSASITTSPAVVPIAGITPPATDVLGAPVEAASVTVPALLGGILIAGLLGFLALRFARTAQEHRTE